MVDWVTLYCSLDGIYLVSGQLKVLLVVIDFYWKGLSVGGEVAEVIGKYHLIAWLMLYIIFIFLHAKEHELQSGWCGLERLMLDHLQGLMVILDNYIPVI